MISISHSSKIINTSVNLPASKSISNRVLIIHFLMQKSFKIDNLSQCNDTLDLVSALNQIESNNVSTDGNAVLVDVGEAGTSYRFLTALLATIPGNFELTGSEKLMKRPISDLIDALTHLGAKISSKNNDGNGPLLISGTAIRGGQIAIEASISSQFISALMLIAPYFKEGLSIELKGKIVSLDYIKLTINIMKEFGAQIELIGNIIHIQPQNYQTHVNNYTVESDWTAASYWYAILAMAKDGNLVLNGLKQNCFQGDRIVADMFSIYGIQSQFNEDGVVLSKLKGTGFIHIFDFVDNPDLVQTFAFLNAAQGLPLQVNNASSLIHKETDRIVAISNEIKKIGGHITINSNDDFYMENKHPELKENTIFKTYQDHRMAMSAALLSMKFNNIMIENEEVVSKSYPNFWKDLSAAGFDIVYCQ